MTRDIPPATGDRDHAPFGPGLWTSPSGPPAPVPDEAVRAALKAVPGYQAQAKEPVWLYPSEGQVRAILEAAAPHIGVPRLGSAECDRLYRMLAEFDDALGAVRRALDFAATETRTEEQGEIVAAARAALRVLEGTEEEAP